MRKAENPSLKPRVLFIYKNKNLADVFATNLRLCGYELHQFYDEVIPKNEMSKVQRVENIFYRVLLKNVRHIHRIHERNFQKHSAKKLAELKRKNRKFDFCFVIRGDLVPEKVLKYARSVSDKMVDYQLDGLSVSSKILDYKYLFDQIYVFDPQDLKTYSGHGLKFITNCYFGNSENSNKIRYDILYIGQYIAQREEDLTRLHNYFGSKNHTYTSLTSLYGSFQPAPETKVLQHTEAISYENNLNLVKKSAVVLDFKRDEHSGLSLRFFEAMQFEKKVITNNASIKNYDFYHSDNIFLTDYENFEGLAEWLQKPYVIINEDIKLKYRFDNWIKEILQQNN